SVGQLSDRLHQWTKPVVEFLLDQSKIAGIGNIYRSEILHASRIAPDRPGTDLDENEVGRIWLSMNRIITDAIKNRGCSIKDYKDTNGEPGDYHRFLKAYGRSGNACSNDGCDGIIKRSDDFDRVVFMCPICQT